MNPIVKAVSIALLLAPALVPAQSMKGSSPAAANHAALVRSVPKGMPFLSNGQRYQILGGTRAVAQAAGETEAKALDRVGARTADLVERKGGFLVYRAAKAAAAASSPRGNTSPWPVAVNVRTGQLGVVSGMINARVKEGADPEAIAKTHGIALVSAAPRIAAAFFRAPAGQDLQVVVDGLAKDPNIVSAETEVIEHFPAPH